MIAFIVLLMAFGISFYCYHIGQMKGWKLGFDEADRIWEHKIEEMRMQNERE